MATYDMNDSPAPETRDESKKISFRFCRECSNMLYPKEDKLNNVLMFACRMCTFAEQAEATCIYRNALKEEIAETAGNVEDVAQDPTVGDDTSSDDYGGYEHPVYDYEDGYGYDSAMDRMDVSGEEVVPEMCTLCGKEILCPYCKQPSGNGVVLETEDPAAAAAEDPRKEEEQVEAEKRERTMSTAGLKIEECKQCGTRDAVFFQSQQRTNETGMALFFVCVECQNVWSTLDNHK
ncbi:hypothetical protein LTR36_008111 [Oleoguttula mirabilis]|uniref:DNA-directed RNA polymerase II subunit RPB9 n=1 Tax=Oleoguttula mirabilis TaxID=1507867 RepID=A0AAV9J9D4_9PEZI|nr:hypothetical protein LTR36_008111 [Oleoguttula mirabilis]